MTHHAGVLALQRSDRFSAAEVDKNEQVLRNWHVFVGRGGEEEGAAGAVDYSPSVAMRGFDTSGCTVTCRGYANLAMHSCMEWANAAERTATGKMRTERAHVAAALAECRAHTRDMTAHCGVKETACVAAAAAASASFIGAEDSCNVCGVHRLLAHFSARDGGRCCAKPCPTQSRPAVRKATTRTTPPLSAEAASATAM